MKKISFKTLVSIYLVIFTLLIIGLFIVNCTNRPTTSSPSLPLYTKLEGPVEDNIVVSNIPNEEDLIKMLRYYEVKYPHIVLAQAKLETGHFTSRVCKEYNNLFGLYNSRKKDYFKFNSWVESILAYKSTIQYRYKGELNNDESYYNFLDSIGYAEDKLYISKLKRIVNG